MFEFQQKKIFLKLNKTKKLFPHLDNKVAEHPSGVLKHMKPFNTSLH